MASTSYAGFQGADVTEAFPDPERGCRVAPDRAAKSNGCITDITVAPVSFASVTDGLSTTLMAAEKAVTTLRVFDVPA